MGNGNSIFVWVENWHPLIKRFGTRIISDAVSAADVISLTTTFIMELRMAVWFGHCQLLVSIQVNL